MKRALACPGNHSYRSLTVSGVDLQLSPPSSKTLGPARDEGCRRVSWWQKRWVAP